MPGLFYDAACDERSAAARTIMSAVAQRFAEAWPALTPTGSDPAQLVASWSQEATLGTDDEVCEEAAKALGDGLVAVFSLYGGGLTPGGFTTTEWLGRDGVWTIKATLQTAPTPAASIVTQAP